MSAPCPRSAAGALGASTLSPRRVAQAGDGGGWRADALCRARSLRAVKGQQVGLPESRGQHSCLSVLSRGGATHNREVAPAASPLSRIQMDREKRKDPLLNPLRVHISWSLHCGKWKTSLLT